MSGWTVFYNAIQYISLVSGFISLFVISLVTIIGLFLSQPSSLVGYQTVAVVLSVIHMLCGITWIILMPMDTYPDETVYLMANIYPYWLTESILAIDDFLDRVAVEMLAVSIIYRTVIVMRPEWQRRMLIILFLNSLPAPIFVFFFSKYDLIEKELCSFACFQEDDPTAIYVVDGRDDSAIVSTVDDIIYLWVIVVGIPCILLLNRWFRMGNFSQKTMKMQRKLTFAMGLMIAIHGVSFICDIFFYISGLLTEFDENQLSPVLTSIGSILSNWILPAKAWIIFLSVKNMLRKPAFMTKISSNCNVQTNVVQQR